MTKEKHTQLHPARQWSAMMVLAAAVSLGAGAQPVMATPLRLPPIVQPASAEQHAGKIVFQELVTPDLASAKRFYSGLFGWNFRDIETGGIKYAEAFMAGRPVAGMLQKDVPRGEKRTPAWLTFISVKDVDAAKSVAAANGAKILLEPRLIRDRGKEAVLADPAGAVFAILASSAGDPPDLLARPGEWIWSSLAAPDPEKEADFYHKLFGYELFDLPSGASGTEHLLLATEQYARASVNQLPPGSSAYPHWLNFVRVRDAEAMAAKAVKLGGTVLVAPRPDRHGGKLAIIADPQGAALGLMEWNADGAEVVK
jgi:uncharacterized protein